MRIGITTFGCDSGTSGISQYTIRLIEHMSRIVRDDSIEVLVYEDEQDIFVPPDIDVDVFYAGKSLRSPVKDIIWHQFTLPRICRERKYDVLFLPAANRRAPLSLSCPSVGTVHDLSWRHVPDKYDRLRLFYLNHLLPIAMRRLSHVIAVSASSKKDMCTYTRVSPDNISVVHNGIDHDVFFPLNKEDAKKNAQERLGIDTPFILYISRLEHPGKNHVRLIQAYEELKHAAGIPHSLVLVGSDYRGAKEIHARAKASPFAENIIFTNYVPNNKLPVLYTAADVFIFPSLYEGFGLPVLEAMACGTPVACARTSSLPEIVGNAAITFDPLRISEITTALRTLTTDKDEWLLRRQEGFAQAGAFSWERTAEATLSLVRNVGNK